MLISYNWLKSYIPEIPKVDELKDTITFHLCELESVEKKSNGDYVFDLKILPDRAHDLLSHRGVAYEIASLLGLEIRENVLRDTYFENLPNPDPYIKPYYSKDDPVFEETGLKIKIETENCHRYMGRIVKGIKVGPSPLWMVQYLENIGQKSINNIVDATNIVMFNCGQPIHAFDLSKLNGILSTDENKQWQGKIVVRNAKEGETLELVGSEKLKANLKVSDVVITDGEKSLAIAGVKGGLDSGINNETINILIEVANFDAVTVRKTARRLGIQTDASKRFENNLSPTLCDLAMKEITYLIFQMFPDASFEEVTDVYEKIPKQRKVSFHSKYISKMLGIEIEDSEIEKILKNYNYEFSHKSDMWEVVVPPMRLDIEGGHDMVEEIGRAYGYDKIIPKIPKIHADKKDNQTWTNICLAKQKLINDGYREVMNYVFINKGEVEVLASASDKKFLRINLIDGLKESIKFNNLNLPLFEMDEVKIFEVGAIFTKEGEQINVAFGDKKNITEMSLDKFLSEKVSQKEIKEFSSDAFVQVLGRGGREPVPDHSQKHTDSNSFEDRKENSSSNSLEFSNNIFKPWSVYPFITRDIAVWVPNEIKPEELINIYKDFGTELLIKEPKLFDSFKKDDKTSYACRLVFQSYDRTLTDKEIDDIMAHITEKIISLGWKVR